MGYVGMNEVPRFMNSVSSSLGAVRDDRIYPRRTANPQGPGYAGPGAHMADQVFNPIQVGIKSGSKAARSAVINNVPADPFVAFNQGVVSAGTPSMDSFRTDGSVPTYGGGVTNIRTGQSKLVPREFWSRDSTNMSFDNPPAIKKSTLVPAKSGLKFSDIVQIDPLVIQTPADADGTFESGFMGDNKNMLIWAMAAAVGFFLFSESKPKRRKPRRVKRRRR